MCLLKEKIDIIDDLEDLLLVVALGEVPELSEKLIAKHLLSQEESQDVA